MDGLSATFAALADPTRRAILARLAQGEATVNELAAPFAMSLPSVSRHLKVLEKAGLISKSREAQWRPRRLEVAPLQDVEAWMEPYRAFFESSFDRLEEHLQMMMAQRNAQSPQPASASDAESATRPKPQARRKATTD
jgi:DNA-binding transcriptional ArsR family regulator